MPTEAELPGDLKELARRNAATIRPGADFEVHAQRLIRDLERLFGNEDKVAPKATPAKRPWWRFWK